MILSDKALRRIIREEFERLMSLPQEPNSYSITSLAGGEIIMPNLIQEKFDAGEVKSIKDII